MRALAAFFVALAVLATAAAAYVAFLPAQSGRAAFWILSAGPPVVLGAVAAAWAAREEFLREWLSPRWGDFTRGLLGAVALYGAAWIVSRAVAPVGSPREIWLVSVYGQIGDPKELHAEGPVIGAAIVAAAFGEELVWRGLVTRLLAGRVGSRIAWIWAAGLYALAFVPTSIALRVGSAPNPLLVAAALAGGLLWGAMARGFGSLVPSVVAHALFDWAVVMMFPLWGGAFRV